MIFPDDYMESDFVCAESRVLALQSPNEYRLVVEGQVPISLQTKLVSGFI